LLCLQFNLFDRNREILASSSDTEFVTVVAPVRRSGTGSPEVGREAGPVRVALVVAAEKNPILIKGGY